MSITTKARKARRRFRMYGWAGVARHREEFASFAPLPQRERVLSVLRAGEAMAEAEALHRLAQGALAEQQYERGAVALACAVQSVLRAVAELQPPKEAASGQKEGSRRNPE